MDSFDSPDGQTHYDREDEAAAREREACPLANAMMALWTLKEAYVADDDDEGARAAQDLWDTADCLNPPGIVGDAP